MPALTTNQSVEAATGNIPELRLPDLHPFAGRARRLRQLAVGHSLGDYLSFAATLAAGDEWLETQADLLLAGDRQGLDVACAPVIGAALQVYWTRLAAALDPAWIARREAPGLYPVCGGPPVAGVVAAAMQTTACVISTASCAVRSGMWSEPGAATATIPKASFTTRWKTARTRSRPKPAPSAAVT